MSTHLSLRVLSYNIHKGFSPGGRNFVLSRIRDAIRSVDADIVLLQEVQGAHSEHAKRVNLWPSQPQFEYLAHELWPHFAYGKNATYAAGHHGNAILSRFPLTSFENIDISTNRLERRGMLHATISCPGVSRPLHAVCVHLGLLEAGRQLQLKRICARILSHVPEADPLLIAGDFNDWRERASALLKRELGADEAHSSLHGEPARTYPTWLPALRLDRVYCRGLDAVLARALHGGSWAKLSDHIPILAELAIPKGLRAPKS